VTQDVEARLRRAVERLPEGLAEHVFRVEAAAVRLAEAHGVDPERARIAALGHDLARAETPEALLRLAVDSGIEPDETERGAPILLHGPVAARTLEMDYGLTDGEVLAAAAYHTTARAGMSRLEKIIFLADKVEEDKVRRRPEWAEVKDLAAMDLDAALLRFLDLQIERALSKGWRIHPRTVAARNELLPG